MLSIGLLSAMLLTLQLSLIQALAFVQGHHLAYVILSVALLGFGAGGSVLTLFARTRSDHLEQFYPILASSAGLAVAWLPRIAGRLLHSLEVDLLFTGAGPWFRLAALGALFCIAFTLGATALTILFRTRCRQIESVYAANLAGSAIGALLAIPLLIVWLPEQVLPLCALMAIAAGALADRCCRRRFCWHGSCAALVLLALLTTPAWSPSVYRDLAYALQMPEHTAAGPYPHFYGRLDIVEAPALRYAPDVSLLYRGVVPAAPHLFVNAERAAVQLDLTQPESRILAHTPQALAYALGRQYRSILLLAPDGNAPVAIAADTGSAVQVVEPHSRLAHYLSPTLPANARLVRMDPRAYLARSQSDCYDLVVFPMRGLFGGPGGLQALGADPLLTVESVTQALQLLEPAGWLAFPVWLDDPLRHSLRVLDLVRQALLVSGVAEPEKHVLLIRGWSSVFIMASPTAVSAATGEHAAGFAAEHGFDLIHPPGETATMHHGNIDAPPATWFQALLSSGADDFLAAYRFDVTAPTDARPFFNQFIRPVDLAQDLAWLSVSERGLTVLYILFVQLALAVVLIILLPLWPLRRHIAGGKKTIAYFSGLGTGFMLYEVALIQLLIPLWATPVVGTAIVITSLLLGMALGSRLQAVMPAKWRRCRLLAFSACLLLLFVGIALPHLMRWIMPFTTPWRLAVLSPIMLIPAILLGMPFPAGIRFLDRTAPEHIPWACGIDGAVAVLASPLAALLAFYFGYPTVVFAAAAAYALSALATLPGWGGAPSQP